MTRRLPLVVVPDRVDLVSAARIKVRGGGLGMPEDFRK